MQASPFGIRIIASLACQVVSVTRLQSVLTLTLNNPDQARNDGRRGVINTFSYSKGVSTITAESLVTARKVMHIIDKYVLESHQRERIMM